MDSRNKILQCGMDLFLENGYSGTSIQMIAGAAGLSKSTLFHYFKSKEDLFNAIFMMCKEAYADNCKSELFFLEADFEIIKESYVFSIEHSRQLKFMMAFEDSPYITNESRQKGISLHQRFWNQILDGQKNGKIVDLPVHFLCMFMGNTIIQSLDYVVQDHVIVQERLQEIISFINKAVKK